MQRKSTKQAHCRKKFTPAGGICYLGLRSEKPETTTACVQMGSFFSQAARKDDSSGGGKQVGRFDFSRGIHQEFNSMRKNGQPDRFHRAIKTGIREYAHSLRRTARNPRGKGFSETKIARHRSDGING